jgi:hypothetical protein
MGVEPESQGDEITVPVQSDVIHSVGHRATILALEDDEPKRRIRIAAHGVPTYGERWLEAWRPGYSHFCHDTWSGPLK